MWQTLKTTDRPIVLYGMGNGAQKIIDELKKIGKTPSGVFASDGFVRGHSFCSMPVMSYAEAKAKFPDMIVLQSFGTQLDDVIANIKRIERETTLFAPDLAVIGEGILTKEYLKNNKNDIEFIYSRLADEQSKKVFKNVLEYKLSGDINLLFDCETTVGEAYDNILKLNDNETYIDLGAYRGDTVDEFLGKVGGFNKIYAVEPDIKSYKKLCLAHSDKAECINAAVSNSVGKVAFNTKNSRSSAVGEGGSLIDAISVDSLSQGATYIKMDVEGNEKNAIIGAKDTIKAFAPKLNIAAYHRVYDLIDLPLEVLKIEPDYKVYLRHFKYIPAWDTNYYFVKE